LLCIDVNKYLYKFITVTDEPTAVDIR